VGFWDDCHDVSFLKRLGIQLLVALVFLMIHLGTLPLWSLLLLMIFMAGFMNAMNFVDGLNGLLGTGVMIALGWAGVAMPETAPLFWSLAAAILGFLVFNWRGLIFMGDVGSLFIGFTIPAILVWAQGQENSPPLLNSILIMGHLLFPYLMDVSLTIILRLKKSQSIVTPHRDFHFHHLNHMGLSHGRIATVYGILVMVQGAIWWLMQPVKPFDFVMMYFIDLAMYLSLMFNIRRASERLDRLTS
jgi:UDP-N-acetylmuramyl pentapeptide phosphotransferase/UDP-N-acetylglucosamine-1-phosphate transferase